MSIGAEDLAGRIVRGLDRGLESIDQRTLARLRSARESALERMEQPEPAWSFAWAGLAGRRNVSRPLGSRHVFSVLALVAAISGMVYWQHSQHVEDPFEIDAKLLSSDLPIDAYLDKGLDTWLTR
jgi:hypothetical protein